MESELLAERAAAGIKPATRIVPCSCACGGRWAWVLHRPDRADVMLGCVCHHWWTLALRAG